jgi:hypothetical protein
VKADGAEGHVAHGSKRLRSSCSVLIRIIQVPEAIQLQRLYSLGKDGPETANLVNDPVVLARPIGAVCDIRIAQVGRYA